MCNIPFGVELNGLQSDRKCFLAIDFSPRHKAKILKKHRLWTFSIVKCDDRKMSCVQFCRANQALSIDTSFDLHSEEFVTRKVKNVYRSIFRTFSH